MRWSTSRPKILVQVDAQAPPAPNTPPTTPSPFAVNLVDNIERLKLDVRQVAPLLDRARRRWPTCGRREKS
jgi:hypothetical protein